MRDEELKELLQRADDGEFSPDPRLPKRVRHKRKIRHIRNSTAAVLLALIATAAIYFDLGKKTSHPPQVVAMELAQLKQTADSYAAQAQLIEAQEKLAKAEAAKYVTEAQREQAARILLDQCDWLSKHDGDATRDYEKLANEFSDTRAGKIAKEKFDDRKEG